MFQGSPRGSKGAAPSDREGSHRYGSVTKGSRPDPGLLVPDASQQEAETNFRRFSAGSQGECEPPWGGGILGGEGIKIDVQDAQCQTVRQ